MDYTIWNKTDKINGVEASHFIKNLNIKDEDEVFLVLKNGVVINVEIVSVIKNNLNLDAAMTTEQVIQEYTKFGYNSEIPQQQRNNVIFNDYETLQQQVENITHALKLLLTEEQLAQLNL